MQRFLTEEELAAIEAAHPEGFSAAQVLELFQDRGLRLSDSSFRKYVQLGLVRPSRRVGTKGRSRGSRGMYPADTPRRVNEIKQLLARDVTLAELQTLLVFRRHQVRQLLEQVRDLQRQLLDSLTREGDRSRAASLDEEVRGLTRTLRTLAGQVERVERLVAVEHGLVTS